MSELRLLQNFRGTRAIVVTDRAASVDVLVFARVVTPSRNPI